jgi:hypothetical protein
MSREKSKQNQTMNEEQRKCARALRLADAMADALNALGEPFPLVRECVKAGQHPQSLVDSMREALVDCIPCEFLDACLECALWSSTGDDGEPLDNGEHDMARETLDALMADCGSFLGEIEEAGIPWRDAWTWEQIGYDFWLTRNGHGAGFWDRGEGELGQRLTESAKLQGSRDLYAGDDGLIYC